LQTVHPIKRPTWRETSLLGTFSRQNQTETLELRTPERIPEENHGAMMEDCMSATGLDVFDKTLQTTHIWLDEIMAKLGPDRQVAWHVLGAVLHALRDRLPIGLAVHLGAQLPLLVRGLYYDQWHPSEQTLKERSAEQFLDHVRERLHDIRPVNVLDAAQVTFQVLNHHVDPHQIEKVRQALPENIRALWSTGAEGRRFEPAA
jgi:uncharacterized protein (DUF2267 family)